MAGTVETPEQIRARLQAQIEAIERGSGQGAFGSAADAGREHVCGTRRGAGSGQDVVEGGRVDSRRTAASPVCEEEEALCFGEGASCGAQASDEPQEVEADKSPEAAFQRIVRLASRSEQASSKLRARLLREGFPEESVEPAIKRALACGLVDDARYAEVLVRSRMAQGRGRQGIALELEKLGIDVADLDEIFEECGQTEIDRALALLDRKPPQAKNVRAAAYRRLVQKGYGSEVASSASRLWCEARERESC